MFGSGGVNRRGTICDNPPQCHTPRSPIYQRMLSYAFVLASHQWGSGVDQRGRCTHEPCSAEGPAHAPQTAGASDPGRGDTSGAHTSGAHTSGAHTSDSGRGAADETLEPFSAGTRWPPPRLLLKEFLGASAESLGQNELAVYDYVQSQAMGGSRSKNKKNSPPTPIKDVPQAHPHLAHPPLTNYPASNPSPEHTTTPLALTHYSHYSHSTLTLTHYTHTRTLRTLTH